MLKSMKHLLRRRGIPLPLLCAALFLVFSASAYAADSPLASIRYWEPAARAEPPVSVPVRSDPKAAVFLYHNLVYGRPGGVYNRDIYNFEHDLAFIRRNFTVVSLEQLQQAVSGELEVVTDLAVITFDDGDLSVYALAYPLLREFELPAAFFLVPSFIGTTGYMNWDQVREMAAWRTPDGRALFEFGSHTQNHAALGELSVDRIVEELSVSKEVIERETGLEVTLLALPYGSGAGRAEVIDSARKLGYRVVRSSREQSVPIAGINLFNLPALDAGSSSTEVFTARTLNLLGRERYSGRDAAE